MNIVWDVIKCCNEMVAVSFMVFSLLRFEEFHVSVVVILWEIQFYVQGVWISGIQTEYVVLPLFHVFEKRLWSYHRNIQ